jgi:hypothetical protein
VDEATFEKLVKVNEIELRMSRAVKEHALRRVLFVDFGKNMLPFYLAARKCGVEVVAIAEQHLAGTAERPRRYRGISIVTDAVAREMAFDAAVVSNVSPVHAAQRRNAWRGPAGSATRLVIDLFEDDRYASVTFADRAARGFPRTVARSA